MKKHRGISYQIISVLFVMLFWIIGAILLSLQLLKVIHIPGIIIWLCFCGPYAIVITAYAIVIAYAVILSRIEDRKG